MSSKTIIPKNIKLSDKISRKIIKLIKYSLFELLLQYGRYGTYVLF